MGMGLSQDFYKELKETELQEQAAQGLNLLGMVDEPKARFGDADVMNQVKKAKKMEQAGSVLMDFFVDPTALFASERHPALQEVLKAMTKNKAHRGIMHSVML